MLAEALGKLHDMIRVDHWKRLEDIEQPGVICLADPVSGEIKTTEVPVPPRVVNFTEIESLLLWLKRFGEAGSDSIYLSENSIVAQLNDEPGQYDVGTLQMKSSDMFDRLTKLEGLTPKAMLQALRFGCFSADVRPGDLVQRLSTLKIETFRESEQQNHPTDTAVKTSVKSQVTGAGGIPEQCEFSFSPYPVLATELGGFTVTIRCAVNIDLDEGLVSIQPFPEEIPQAKLQALQHVAQVLKTAMESLRPAPVYLGMPDNS